MSAESTMRSLNPEALHCPQDYYDHFIEDVLEDGMYFRLEYRCREDGSEASAWLLYNPFGDNPFTYIESHLREDGQLCIGKGISDSYSPYSLEYAVKRARFWVTGYCFLMENGYAATCRELPEWRFTGR